MMMKNWMYALIAALVYLPACSGSGDSGTEGDGDGDRDVVGDGDVAAASGGTSSGGTSSGGTSSGGTSSGGTSSGGATLEGSGGSAEQPSGACAPEATTGADGILKAYPDLQVTISEGWTVVSAHGVQHETSSDSPYTNFYFEVQNTGTESLCDIFPEATLNGVSGVLIQAVAPPYKPESSNIVRACAGPGESAVVWITDIDVPEGGHESAVIDIEMLGTTPTQLSPVLPQLSQTVDADSFEVEAGDFGITGSVTFSTSLHNYAFDVFVKDSQGLIVADFFAYPGDGESFVAGQSAEFESNAVFGNACEFTSFVHYDTWIVE